MEAAYGPTGFGHFSTIGQQVPVTIREVAKRLNLSVTTVSRALTGYSDVADATRQRVIDVAREMEYVPSRAARQLRRQRMETIGLVFPTIGARFSDPFFSEFIAGVGDEASRKDYDLLVSVASPGEAEEATYERLVNSRRVDGFVLVRMRLQDWRIVYLSSEGIPFVSFGRSMMDKNAPHVGVDGRAGVRELVSHLVSQGHRRIAFIAAPEGLTLARDRLDGYGDGLSDAGITFDPELVIKGSLTRSAGYEAAKELLKRVPPPSAIIGANDLSALGAMRAVQERGMAIGRELAIAGFDGIEASEHSLPALTTVHQPVYDIGRRVCSMLISIIEGEECPETEILIKPTLVIRQSTLNGKE
ncbi:MAG: LacI family DNA-binding transcriptional regulator [Anaerolineae bacterium]|nr:MAG: LacI family DNA-binding transcriptional regulator [Anaerolineae bacterium]